MTWLKRAFISFDEGWPLTIDERAYSDLALKIDF